MAGPPPPPPKFAVDSVSQHRAFVTLPKNNIAFIFGTATAAWTQDVKVKPQFQDDTDLQAYTLQASNNPLEVTHGGSGIARQSTIVINPDSTRERQLELLFRVVVDGKLRDVHQLDTHVDKPVPWVTNYTYNTEDGGDHDVHDTTLVVSVIDSVKSSWPIGAANGTAVGAGNGAAVTSEPLSAEA
ncbi:hypothetical protein JAAARDRAFT_58756 [Jaapia argillacea MUCL 33604]|uniref:Uncharacterized protein n=1 Tax=Jaapia argillacea MUCL 33604 TaxID=933084 RepID=A0A067PTX1_9AGAM|nr:hypothetical protein JAAARDRAFT_58756 [Jaapia argillacea MUCL 33604]